MTTSNIISTPNITGNIGVCASSVSTVTTQSDFWGYSTKDYLTNSCTGQVIEQSEHWNAGFMPVFVPFFVLFLLGYLLIAIADNL